MSIWSLYATGVLLLVAAAATGLVWLWCYLDGCRPVRWVLRRLHFRWKWGRP